ncbi:hypothetical protein JJD41_18880 [Oxynema sp. CENA135]|nr:hypothetical protein [Oxynema sp. CENA135]MBK4731919.1 hypothetical protein [Oxynema sp. CENA135]
MPKIWRGLGFGDRLRGLCGGRRPRQGVGIDAKISLCQTAAAIAVADFGF